MIYIYNVHTVRLIDCDQSQWKKWRFYKKKKLKIMWNVRTIWIYEHVCVCVRLLLFSLLLLLSRNDYLIFVLHLFSIFHFRFRAINCRCRARAPICLTHTHTNERQLTPPRTPSLAPPFEDNRRGIGILTQKKTANPSIYNYLV